MKLPKKGRLVIVKWLDASGSNSWYSSGHTLPLCVNKTVGYLTGKTRRKIVLTAALSDGDAPYGIRMAIPRANVTDVRLLKIGGRP